MAELAFHAPQISGSGTRLDGNLSDNRTVLTADVAGFVWEAGQTLWLRWHGVDAPASDHGLAVDDVHFAAVPEPATLAALGLGVVAVLRRRRR